MLGRRRAFRAGCAAAPDSAAAPGPAAAVICNNERLVIKSVSRIAALHPNGAGPGLVAVRLKDSRQIPVGAALRAGIFDFERTAEPVRCHQAMNQHRLTLKRTRVLDFVVGGQLAES